MENREYYFYKKDSKNRWQVYAIKQKNGNIRETFTCDTENEAKEIIERYNTKYSLTDYSNEEIKYFYNSIDFKKLKEAINNYVGEKLTYNIYLESPDRFDRLKYFSIETSENLALNNHLISIAWKTFKVDGCYCSISCDPKTGELMACGSINYHYEHLAGGSNGATLMSFSYSKKSGWYIITEQERKKRMEEYYGK